MLYSNGGGIWLVVEDKQDQDQKQGGVSCDCQLEKQRQQYVTWLQVKDGQTKGTRKGEQWYKRLDERDGNIMTEETAFGRIRIWEPEIGADPCCVVAPGWR
jgi:hypothetical protein